MTFRHIHFNEATLWHRLLRWKQIQIWNLILNGLQFPTNFPVVACWFNCSIDHLTCSIDDSSQKVPSRRWKNISETEWTVLSVWSGR